MAEAIGAASAVITLLDTARRLDSLIREIKRAPDEILAINNEVADLQLLVFQLQQLTNADLTVETYLATPLQTALAKLRAVDELLRRLKGRPKRIRIEWARIQQQIRQHQAGLRDARLQLTSCLSVATVSAKNIEIQAEIANFKREFFLELAETHALMNSLRSSQTSVHEITESTQKQTTSHTISPVSMNTPRLSSNLSHQTFPIPVRALQGRRKSCRVGCACSCHRRASSNTFWDTFFGSLSVNYSGLSQLVGRCSDPFCNTSLSHSSVEVEYKFPSWLLLKTMHLNFLFGHLNEPSISLTVKNVIPQDHPWLKAAAEGDVEAIRRMIVECPSRVNDVSELGVTAATLAAAAEHDDCLKLLADAGADLNVGKGYATALNIIGFYVFLFDDPDLFAQFLSTYTLSNYVDDMPELHKVLLGVIQKNFRTSLAESAGSIDDVDSAGRTALWWASALGMEQEVRDLLNCGADVEIADDMGDNALFALRYGGLNPQQQAKVVKLLLQSQPLLTAKSYAGLSLWHVASGIIDQSTRTELMQECIKQGVDVHSRECIFGQTPMLGLSSTSYTSMDDFDLLLSAGATRNDVDKKGRNMLHLAIKDPNPEALSWALSNRVNHQCINKYGETVLHYSSRYINIKIIRILTNHGLAGLDPDKRDKWGYTAMDNFKNYCQDNICPQETRDAFYELMDKVRFGDRVREIDDDDDSAQEKAGRDQARASAWETDSDSCSDASEGPRVNPGEDEGEQDEEHEEEAHEGSTESDRDSEVGSSGFDVADGSSEYDSAVEDFDVGSERD